MVANTALEDGAQRIDKALASYPHTSNDPKVKIASSKSANSKLLYDPTTLKAKPISLLADGVPHKFQGHTSDEIYNALLKHANKMHLVEAEFNKHNKSDKASHTYHGHESAELAEAFAKYAKTHNGFPADFKLSDLDGGKKASSVKDSKTQTASTGDKVLLAGAAAGAAAGSAAQFATVGDASSVVGAFSFAALLSNLQWASFLYGITWMGSGLLLAFFGYSSYFWLNRVRVGKSKSGGCILLGGGIGGALMGFTFFSMLASVVLNTVCSHGKSPLSSGAFFPVWLAPGLLGMALGGHFQYFGRLLAGLTAGPCATIILTAVFGIHTLLIRVILLAVFTTVLTSPLLMPRLTLLQRHLLNLCTSIVGMTMFLDGVALFAPPVDSSHSWIDLWVVLFATDESASEKAAIEAWGTGAFKGYIAGAVIGVALTFVFEAIFHRHAAENADEEWNSYLGSYTGRIEKAGGMPGGFAGPRAGLFEPAPNVWRRLGDLFDTSSPQPATYGNLAGGQGVGSSLTERPSSRARSTRSARTARGAPARFSALSKRDRDVEAGDSDSDATEFDSDDEDKTKGVADVEERDALSPLATENYGGYALPVARPPSYRTDSKTSSTMSGSTAKGSDGGGVGTTGDSSVERSQSVYRDGDASASSPLSSRPQSPESNRAASPVVAATPSLINAISRIQQAQAQAMAWQAQSGAAAPYGPNPSSPPPPPDATGGQFEQWWKKEVNAKR